MHSRTKPSVWVVWLGPTPRGSCPQRRMLASLSRLSPRWTLASTSRVGLPPAVLRAGAALSVRSRSLKSATKAPADKSVGAITVPAAEAAYPPLFSRRARRERLQAALDVARAGGEFVLPEAQPSAQPGPCGAVMTILRDVGPKTSSELWELLQERFPGVIRYKRNMKRDVLMAALKNKARAWQCPFLCCSPDCSHPRLLSPPSRSTLPPQTPSTRVGGYSVFHISSLISSHPPAPVRRRCPRSGSPTRPNSSSTGPSAGWGRSAPRRRGSSALDLRRGRGGWALTSR
jgi:hypothetical protein